jgi:hypothetical protein
LNVLIISFYMVEVVFVVKLEGPCAVMHMVSFLGAPSV